MTAIYPNADPPETFLADEYQLYEVEVIETFVRRATVRFALPKPNLKPDLVAYAKVEADRTNAWDDTERDLTLGNLKMHHSVVLGVVPS